MSSFSRMHFHDTDIKELIRKYKQYQCLWNYNSPNYKNKSMKQEAWKQISNFFHKDVSEVKRKIKYLRSAYVGEKRKVEASKKSGTGTPHIPILFYYNDLDFLDRIVVLRKYETDGKQHNIEFENVDVSQDTEEYTDPSNFESDGLKEAEMNCKIEIAEDQLTPSQKSLNYSPKIVCSQSLSHPGKRKINRGTNCNKSIKSRTQSLSLNQSEQFKNVYNSFGKTIALQLQQLPLEAAVLAMSEIHTIITKKTLEHIRFLQNDHSSNSSSESVNSFNGLIEEETFVYSD